MPVIGYLSGATFETMRDYVAAFRRGLADEGFFEGRNVAIEYRWAESYMNQFRSQKSRTFPSAVATL